MAAFPRTANDTTNGASAGTPEVATQTAIAATALPGLCKKCFMAMWYGGGGGAAEGKANAVPIGLNEKVTPGGNPGTVTL